MSPDNQRSRDLQTPRKRLIADRVARWLVSAGGLAIIVSILGILVFILAEVWPLMSKARVRAVREIPLPGPPAGALVSDEHRTHVAALAADGHVRIVRLRDGQVAGDVDLGTGPLTGMKVPAGRPVLTGATRDGRVVLAPVAFEVTFEGQTQVVTAGRAGSKKVVRENTYVDGKLDSSTVLSQKVLTQPVDAVVRVGTKPAPSAGDTSGAGINLANEAMWDRIAQCESGGNWHINTGNGYYGGLQFATASWLAMGGDDFAPRADLASRAEQITVANRYYAQAGLSPWGCAHAA